MIVTDLETHYRLITQNDHAHWAYQLMGLWPTLRQHPRQEAILDAARLHDRGWHGVDASPMLSDDGRPHDFRTLPTAERDTVWRRGIEGNTAASPNAEPSLKIRWRELLICHHAWFIHRPERGMLSGSQRMADALMPLFTVLAAERSSRIDTLAQKLRDQPDNALDLEADTVEENLTLDYSWLGTLDFLSLIACCGWGDDFELTLPTYPRTATKATLSARGGNDNLQLAPYPLAGSYSLAIRCREIPKRPYRSNSDLSLELARACWQAIGIRVSKANP